MLTDKLRERGVDAVLYGSRGVGLYLGDFKEFNDTDLLVDDAWLGERWGELQAVMAELGYRLVDEREHEFHDIAGAAVAFAAKSILVRDGIVASVGPEDLVVVRGIKTLPPEVFLKVYKYSIQDGYRVEVRGKKDAETIAALERYLAG
jgi:hypothetical protein